jgi:hypothetical protein
MPVPSVIIEQTIPLPSPVPETPDAPVAPASVDVGADLQREYLVGGGLLWWPARVRALPPWIDEPSRDFPGTYDAMMTDPQVSSTVDLRRLAALAQGWSLTVPAGQEDDPQAEAIRAFCEADYRALRTPLPRVLFELAGALIHGYAPAEQVYDLGADGQLHLVDLKPKACEDLVLYVDAFGNEIGYRPIVPGQPVPWAAPWNPDATDSAGQPLELYDRRKLVIHKHQPTARRLLGTSALRPAWEDWWFKKQLDPEHLKFVVQFASPTLHGQVDPAAKPYRERDPNGQVIPNGKLIYPEEKLAGELQKVHNASYIVTTANDQITPITVQSEGNVFLLAYSLKDHAITKAVLYQTLATEEAEHMARAASDTHQDVLDLVFSWDKEGLETTIRRESLYWLVFYNFGQADADKYTPIFNLPRVAHQDINALRTAIAALQKSGYLHRSQYAGLDKQADLPARDQVQADADYERGLAAQEAAARAQQPPPPPGVDPAADKKQPPPAKQGPQP